MAKFAIRLAAACGVALMAGPVLAEAPRLPTDEAGLLDSDLSASKTAAATPNHISVLPRVEIGYDSNVFQLNDDRITGSPGDWIVTPGLALELARSIGRNSVNITADAGYQIYKTHTELNQIRANVAGQAHVALGGVCTADPTAKVRIQQNNDAQLATTAKNSQTVQDYAITLACQRPMGFYPSATVTRETVNNGDALRALVNQRAQGVEGGIGYALPSLGSLLFEYGRQWIRQPNRETGDETDGSDVTRYTATFTRAVAPRLSFQLGGSYLEVSPRGTGLGHYGSGGYDVTVDYHPSPRYALVATATRDITGSGDVAVSYVVASTYGLRGTARFSRRASISIGGEYGDYRYRGEDPILYPVPRIREHATTVSTDMRYDLGQLIQLGLYARYAVVDAVNDLYDYDRVQGGLSVAARF